MKTILSASAVAVLLAACAMQETAGPKASAVIRPASGTQVHGEVTFTQIGPDRVRVSGEIAGHTSGPKGFHIHENGDCSAPDAMSAGGHFNPMKRAHGPSTTQGHSGDLGNITFSDTGKAEINMVIEGVSVSSTAPNGLIGKAVVVHVQPDDLKTNPDGSSGVRAACGVIS